MKLPNGYGSVLARLIERTYERKYIARITTSLVYKYAIKSDIVSKNYGELLEIGKSPRKGQALIFTDEQIECLWKLY